MFFLVQAKQNLQLRIGQVLITTIGHLNFTVVSGIETISQENNNMKSRLLPFYVKIPNSEKHPTNENTGTMKFTRRVKINKFISLLIIIFILKLLWHLKSVRKIKKHDPFIFDEKPILSEENVEYYTKEELEPGFKRPAKGKSLPGEGGKPVILTPKGNFVKFINRKKIIKKHKKFQQKNHKK